MVYIMTFFIEGFKDVKKWIISQYLQDISGKYSSS